MKWALYAGALRLGWTQWNLPGGVTGLRRPVDIFVPESPAAYALWLPALFAGALLLARGEARQRRWLGLTLLLTVASLGVVAFFFGYARLGLLLLPLWMGVAASALVAAGRALLERLPADQRRPFRAPAAARSPRPSWSPSSRSRWPAPSAVTASRPPAPLSPAAPASTATRRSGSGRCRRAEPVRAPSQTRRQSCRRRSRRRR